MTTVARVNIPELLARSRIGPLQKRVFTLCLLTLIIDGFDVQAMGFLIPALSADWNVEPAQFRTVLPAANFGVLIGSLVFSPLADKVGRRPVLVWATLWFAVVLGLVLLAVARGRIAQRQRAAPPT